MEKKKRCGKGEVREIPSAVMIRGTLAGTEMQGPVCKKLRMSSLGHKEMGPVVPLPQGMSELGSRFFPELPVKKPAI